MLVSHELTTAFLWHPVLFQSVIGGRPERVENLLLVLNADLVQILPPSLARCCSIGAKGVRGKVGKKFLPVCLGVVHILQESTFKEGRVDWDQTSSRQSLEGLISLDDD